MMNLIARTPIARVVLELCCHGPRLCVNQTPIALICVPGVPNAFTCVSPNASAEFTTELASLVFLCSLRSHFFQWRKLEFFSEEHSCLNIDSCFVVDSCVNTDSCQNTDS